MLRKFFLMAAAAALAGGFAVSAEAASTLETVKQRGKVKCVVAEGSVAIAQLNDKGQWEGFDVDYCRALGAAIFGSGDAVEFVPMSFAQSMPAVRSGEAEVAARAITYTMSRDTELGFDFIGPTLYSGYGFMVHKRAGVTDLKGLDGAAICVLAGTVIDSQIADYFRPRGMKFTPVVVDNVTNMYAQYEAGRCDVVTSEPPFLAARRSRLRSPDDHIILKELFYKSHMGPVVRDNDAQFAGIARWTHYALVTAEEMGITQANLDEMLKSKDPAVRRFLGLEGNLGSKMGLTDDFPAKIIRAVGNFGEVWDRNFGMKSPLKLPRGINALERDGGLQWAPNWR